MYQSSVHQVITAPQEITPGTATQAALLIEGARQYLYKEDVQLEREAISYGYPTARLRLIGDFLSGNADNDFLRLKADDILRALDDVVTPIGDGVKTSMEDIIRPNPIAKHLTGVFRECMSSFTQKDTQHFTDSTIVFAFLTGKGFVGIDYKTAQWLQGQYDAMIQGYFLNRGCVTAPEKIKKGSARSHRGRRHAMH